MKICTAKFKVRDAVEALFVTDMVERVKQVTEMYNLPITRIRFGRQVKSWGSTSVADYHVYRYGGERDPNTGERGEPYVELWVNGHKCDMSEEGRKYLEWKAILGCTTWSKINKEVNVTKEDVTAFALKYKYKDNKKLKEYLEERAYADKIAGTQFAFVDHLRQQELDEAAAERAARLAARAVTA